MQLSTHNIINIKINYFFFCNEFQESLSLNANFSKDSKRTKNSIISGVFSLIQYGRFESLK